MDRAVPAARREGPGTFCGWLSCRVSRTPSQEPVPPRTLRTNRVTPDYGFAFLFFSSCSASPLTFLQAESDAFSYSVQLNEAIFLLSPLVIHPCLRHIPYLRSSTQRGAPCRSPHRVSACAGSDKGRWQDPGSRAPPCKCYRDNGVLRSDPYK